MDTDTKIKILKVTDSRTESHQEPRLVTPDGPASVTHLKVNADDPTSQSPTFTVNVPSYRTGLGRRVLLKFQGTITITGTGLDLLTHSNRIALRAFPLHNIMSSCNLMLNDQTVSMGSLSQYVAGLLRVGQVDGNYAMAQSTCPAVPDMFSSYDDAVGALSPFNAPGDFVPSSGLGSSRVVGIKQMVLNGTTEIILYVDFAEPLLVQPFSVTDEGSDKALYGLDKAVLSCTYANVHRMLSIAEQTGANITGVTLTPTTQQLQCTFITPSDRSIVMRDPKPSYYRYVNIKPFTTTIQETLAGSVLDPGQPKGPDNPPPAATATGSFNAIEFSTVPSRLLIFATYSEQNRTDATESYPDHFLPIEQISISFGQRSGLLSGAAQEQLWEMSSRHGINMPYWQWAGLRSVSSDDQAPAFASGGPLLLDVAADLSLPDGMVPGQNKRVTFSIDQLRFANNSKRQIVNPRIYVIDLTEGIMKLHNGSCRITIGGVPDVSSETFAVADEMTTIQFRELMESGAYGGSKFMDFLRGVGKGIKQALPFATSALSMVAPELAPVAGLAAKLAGSGRNGNYY